MATRLRHPGPLAGIAWLEEHLGHRDLVLLEVDERPPLYRVGHIPGAHGLDWHADLQDPVTRDLPDAAAMARLWRRVGVTEDSVVVLYGDQDNWYACFGYWLFRLYGLRAITILDGGRPAWVTSGRPMTRDEPPAGARSDPPEAVMDGGARAFWPDVAGLGERDGLLIDVRTAEEYRGDLLTEPGYPLERAQRAGHIPGAHHLPWDEATALDGTFRPVEELRELYTDRGIDLDRPIVTYCRIGERSAHTWFVLSELLGAADAQNYDGSWTEWGSMVRMPVALGAERGELTRVPVPTSER
jgi:thiosulfate/3-mercaptopyruvate sulfurtransferase